jgi:DNA-binding protein H-NS
MSYSDLLAQKAALDRQAAELEKQLAQARKEERSGVITQIKSLMAEHGLTVEDLAGKVAKAGKAPKESANKGRTVAPKFKDPTSGDTWSGRGLKPRWLAAALDAGKKLEDFAI